MTVRYGIIGAGMMAREHMMNLALIPGSRVAAIADPDKTMLTSATEHIRGSARLFNDHRSLLEADICDAYIVASPNHTHYGILLDLLPVNKPVLVEKPLCITSRECRQVIDLARERSAPAWVAMEYRYMPPVELFCSLVEKGVVGRPVMMTIREYRYPFLHKVADWNRFNRLTGGTLVEKCCHFWDLMRLVLHSDPVRIYASGAVDVNHRDERYDGMAPDILDNALAVVDFANGTRAMLDLCMFAEGCHWQEEISVTGDKARLDVRIPGPARFDPEGKAHQAEIELSARDGKSSPIDMPDVDETVLKAGDHHGATFFQHRKFHQLARTGHGDAEVTLEDGLWSVLTGEAGELSARTGKAVNIVPPGC